MELPVWWRHAAAGAGGLCGGAALVSVRRRTPAQHSSSPGNTRLASLTHALPAATPAVEQSRASGGAVTREELGRCTWTLLHTLAAQYPEQPTKQQQRDACELVMILTRLYPCRECAGHFAELVGADPPSVASRGELSQWMCRAHNTVSTRLGKPAFNCARVSARWGLVKCVGDACSLEPQTPP